MSAPLKVFFSYSREDEDLCKRLETHLSMLKKNRLISVWNDRMIIPGEEWQGKIGDSLNNADIVLLLVTANFLSSDFCDIEMTRALKRHSEGKARVIPIMLAPVEGWEHSPFSGLQVLPRNAKPVTRWNDQDEAFVNVAQEIRKAISDFVSKKEREVKETNFQEPKEIRIQKWVPIVRRCTSKIRNWTLILQEWVLSFPIKLIRFYGGYQNSIDFVAVVTLIALSLNLISPQISVLASNIKPSSITNLKPLDAGWCEESLEEGLKQRTSNIQKACLNKIKEDPDDYNAWKNAGRASLVLFGSDRKIQTINLAKTYFVNARDALLSTQKEDDLRDPQIQFYNDFMRDFDGQVTGPIFRDDEAPCSSIYGDNGGIYNKSIDLYKYDNY
ncbi:MAG: toll/interleukin-1 receptor domain-containing protein, partial [Cyanobacteria bacterium P01_D01_bin.56]